MTSPEGSDVVALKPSFGSVAASPDGRVLVSVGDVVLRLQAAEYWTFMEMLSEAARRLAGLRHGAGTERREGRSTDGPD